MWKGEETEKAVLVAHGAFYPGFPSLFSDWQPSGNSHVLERTQKLCETSEQWRHGWNIAVMSGLAYRLTSARPIFRNVADTKPEADSSGGLVVRVSAN